MEIFSQYDLHNILKNIYRRNKIVIDGKSQN